jgi:hypothetical protein
VPVGCVVQYDDELYLKLDEQADDDGDYYCAKFARESRGDRFKYINKDDIVFCNENINLLEIVNAICIE